MGIPSAAHASGSDAAGWPVKLKFAQKGATKPLRGKREDSGSLSESSNSQPIRGWG